MRWQISLAAFVLLFKMSLNNPFAAENTSLRLGAIYAITGGSSTYGLPSFRGPPIIGGDGYDGETIWQKDESLPRWFQSFARTT